MPAKGAWQCPNELLTVMSEVKAALNSRPLTYDYNIPGEELLTPAHVREETHHSSQISTS